MGNSLYESAIGIVRTLRLKVTRLDDVFTGDYSDNYKISKSGIGVKNPDILLVSTRDLEQLSQRHIDVQIIPRAIYGTLDGYGLKLNIKTKKILCPEDLPKKLEEKVQKVAKHYKWKLAHSTKAYQEV